jgi:alpha-tubulin suppressor-like RCC1 family protein
MRSPKVSYGLALPWSTCRSSRGFLAVLTPALVAALACGEAVESPTAPSSERALAPAATATLAFRQVSAGYYHTCGVTTDDRAFCWGEGSSGELGDGTNTSQLSPVAVAGGLRFRQVSAGTSYTCGVTIDDAAYCWGDNGAGQLGTARNPRVADTTRLAPTRKRTPTAPGPSGCWAGCGFVRWTLAAGGILAG